MIDKIQLLKALEIDSDLKMEVAVVLCKDKDFLREMGMRVMGVSLLELGINSPGTLGEFIYNNVKRSKKNK